MNRRQWLRTAPSVTTLLVAGCLSERPAEASPSTDFAITNWTDTAVSVQITVTDVERDDRIIDETIDLPADDSDSSKRYRDVLSPGEYEIAVETSTGLARTIEHEEERGDKTLEIVIEESEISVGESAPGGE